MIRAYIEKFSGENLFDNYVRLKHWGLRGGLGIADQVIFSGANFLVSILQLEYPIYQQTPENEFILYRNWTVLSQFRLDHRQNRWEPRVPLSTLVFRSQGDWILKGPTVLFAHPQRLVHHTKNYGFKKGL